MCSREDTEDMNRERAEIYLRLLSEAELRRARMLPRPGFGARKIAPGSQWWHRRWWRWVLSTPARSLRSGPTSSLPSLSASPAKKTRPADGRLFRPGRHHRGA